MTGFAPGDDRGLLLGDGLFETLLCRDGRPVQWEAHVRRLERGCAVLALPAPDRERLWAAAQAALAEAGLALGLAAMRLTWTAGSGGRGLERPAEPQPRLLAQAAPVSGPQEPAVLAVSAIRRNETSPASRLKTLAYLDNVLARREALAQGADEALMLNGRGEIAGAAAANLFWLQGRRLFTPALACGALDGTVRALVIAAASRLGLQVEEVRAPIAALAAAEAAFLTNSLIGARAVREIDGRRLGAREEVAALADLAISDGGGS
jgi:branched-chain amino acid aminotransferase/4-amino-4-deoxychorismate lyase